MKILNHRLSLAITFLWIGFVCAISFMEAWLKFRAPGVTLSIGLAIGKLVFSALNRMELLFGFLLILSFFIAGNKPLPYDVILFGTIIAVLLVQTFWILPELSKRADLIIQNKKVLESNLHVLYVGMEVSKVVLLSFFGNNLFKKK